MCKSTFYSVKRLNTHTEKQHKRENHILTPDESPSKSSSICSPPLKQRKEDDIRENDMDKEKTKIVISPDSEWLKESISDLNKLLGDLPPEIMDVDMSNNDPNECDIDKDNWTNINTDLKLYVFLFKKKRTMKNLIIQQKIQILNMLMKNTPK